MVLLSHDEAVDYGGKVQTALNLAKLDDVLYVSILIKENGNREIVIRKKNAG